MLCAALVAKFPQASHHGFPHFQKLGACSVCAEGSFCDFFFFETLPSYAVSEPLHPLLTPTAAAQPAPTPTQPCYLHRESERNLRVQSSAQPTPLGFLILCASQRCVHWGKVLGHEGLSLPSVKGWGAGVAVP